MASGSLKKEANGTYSFVVDVGQNGERKQARRRGFKSKKEAEDARTELLNQVNKGEYIASSKMTLTNLMLLWLEEKQDSMTRLTIDSYKSYITNHISPPESIGGITLGNLTSDDIRKLVAYLKGKQLSESTVQRIFNIVISALNHAIKKKLIRENVAKLVDRPKISRRKLQVWTPDEVNIFLDHIKNYRHFIAFYLAIYTGMRQGEILGLPWNNIDFDNKVIRVTQTLEHDAKNIKQGTKTLAGIRSISVDDDVIDTLKEHKKMIQDEREYVGKEVYQDNDLVVCTNIGKPVFADTLTKFMRKSIKEIGLNPIRFHDLRHTSASLMLMLGYNPKVISERLGHASVTITLDTYSHLLPNMQEEVAKGLSKLLKKKD